MNRALEEAFGHPGGLDGIPVAGRTDWAILSDAVRRVGRALDVVVRHADRPGAALAGAVLAVATI